MKINNCVEIEELIDEFCKRTGEEYDNAWVLFETECLTPDGCKPACFGKYSDKVGIARSFMDKLLKELNIERLYIVNAI